MAGFSGEEKLDLLYKKVAFGVNKSGTSEQFLPSNETTSTYLAIKPTDVWQDANPTNVPPTPPTATTTYVKRYAVLEGGSQPANTTAVVECTRNGDSLPMPGQSTFTRSWKTNVANWIGPSYGAGYLIKVYVGPSGWNGDTTNVNVTQIIFGANQSRDWFFDYEAGMLYWTNDNESTSDSYQGSNNWTAFNESYVVYVSGYQYIGNFGVGGQSAAQVAITQTDTPGVYYPVFVSGESASETLYIDQNSGGNDAPFTYDAGTNILSVFGTLTSLELSTGSITATGAVSLTGNVSLASGNTSIALNGAINSNIVPLGVTQTIGDVNTPWSAVYANSIYFEGTANNNETQLTAVDPTADRIIQLPDATGTVALTSDLTNFLTAADISTFIEGVEISEASNGTPYKLALTTGTNGATVTTQYVDTELTYNPSSTSNAGTLGVGNISVAGNATISGNLTVAGSLVQQNSTTVVFNDTFLALNTANSAQTYDTDSGLHFGRKTSSANTLSEYAAFTYDGSADQFKFTRYTDSTIGDVAFADNVAALKFDKSDTVTAQSQGNGDDSSLDTEYANSAIARSLGAVAKCTITITSYATDGSGGTNYAPVIGALNGYVIKHNLGTKSVYVIAIKDPSNTAVPVYCKYEPIDTNSLRVMVGQTVEDEVYDIIVIG
jgi:hypothetical protein